MKAREYIRNFSIIAHIDHGKSTLADRLLELTGTVDKKKMKDQILDDMDLERERGITIKSHSIQMNYNDKSGESYSLNLIDTPGHVDFTYEVSRSLAACEGAVLIVDASQGIEAQTISNVYLAKDNNLAIIPVINKIDLQSANREATKKQMSELLEIAPDDILPCCAKSGEGVPYLLDKIINKIPPPTGDPSNPLQALIFDSVFDPFRGAIAYVRVFEGVLNQGDIIHFFSTKQEYEVAELGIFEMERVNQKTLYAGQVGYIIANIKNISDIKIGDTVTTKRNGAKNPVKGFKEVKPMVFSGLYPVEKADYENLRKALDRLKLNDSSISFVPENSDALGFGFRAGFLGLLHKEIIQERLSREYGVDIITTVPNVKYKVKRTTGEDIFIESPCELPPAQEIESISEPIVNVRIITPTKFVGSVMDLCEEKRGQMDTMEYLDTTRVCISYHIPLAELIIDFFDRLKSCSRGYASMDYEFESYQKNDLIKLDILINGSPVEAFSRIIHRDKAYFYGMAITSRLKDIIPRQMYAVAIQASIGTRVIARSTVKAYRKDVTSKCYGGDVTRKNKLLEKQKEGKKRLKKLGNIEIPQEAFLTVLTGNKQ